ncbi:MAG: DUF2185 domain-containing protein [Phycisphaerae bacterium]|nr:DUF2185 domain-containing protein [Phycisphaerae bacterium]
MAKRFKLAASEIQRLIPSMGYCFATDRITVDGVRVGYMYREDPDRPEDSGWRFLSGDESDAYMDNADNHGIYDVNTIANLDREILPFVHASVGSRFFRDDSGILRPEPEPD